MADGQAAFGRVGRVGGHGRHDRKAVCPAKQADAQAGQGAEDLRRVSAPGEVNSRVMIQWGSAGSWALMANTVHQAQNPLRP